MDVNILIINGKCLSMDCNIVYNWIGISNNRIVALGFGDEYKNVINHFERLIDAEGKTVLPGFIDSHFHMVQTALNRCFVDLSEAKSFKDIGDLIAEAGRSNPGSNVKGIRIDQNNLIEKRMPNRHEIDEFWNDTAVWLNSYDYVTSALNTYGLLYYKIPFTQVGVQYDDKNMPTGIFKLNANAQLRANILNEIDDFYRLDALSKLMPHLAANGLTTVNAVEGGVVYCDRDAAFIYDVIKHKRVYLDMELFFQTFDLERIQEMGLKRVGGSLYVDGTFNSRAAAISFDYNDAKGVRGTLNFTQDKLDMMVEQCYRRNLQLALYTLGDRAIDMALKAHERAVNLTGKTNLRHRLEHVELPTDEHIKMAKELGIIFSMQPTYELIWGGPNKMYSQRLGDRYKDTNPLRKIIDGGVKICGGTDSDTTETNYIYAIYAAVNHSNPQHRIQVIEAIEMFTCNGAYAINKENEKGFLKIGYEADIVVLDDDIMSINKENIKDIKVRTTIKLGKIIYENGQFIEY
ncbi:MAG: amidohydrolase [Clostridium sp.]|uniref:amidohydrolase n=1 Tax=Clostridium sp. TaxID=1506 RepID=UPI003028C52C